MSLWTEQLPGKSHVSKSGVCSLEGKRLVALSGDGSHSLEVLVQLVACIFLPLSLPSLVFLSIRSAGNSGTHARPTLTDAQLSGFHCF